MQSDPTMGTRGFPLRDGGFRSPASAVGVLTTPIARRANQRQITQTVAVETLARRVGPPSLKASSGQQQQQQDRMQTGKEILNSTAAAAARAATADAGGVMARTVVINSTSNNSGRKGVKAAEDVVLFNRRMTNSTGAARGIASHQAAPTTLTPVAKGLRAAGIRGGIGQVRGAKVDREVRCGGA